MADNAVSADGDAEPASKNFQVGQRVHAAGQPRRVGTVKYVGAVAGHPGEWVGVDWDDGNGKNDGSVDGNRYFTASGERSASFTRPRNISTGVAFVEAMHLRYLGECSKEEEEEMYVLSKSNNRVAVQFVGKSEIQEKLKKFEDLLSASVSYMGVSSVGSPDEINSFLPNLKELDLTGNLLTKWQDISILCQALTSLEVLDLTNNMMEGDTEELPSSKSIHILVLNNCAVTWEMAEKLISLNPSVQELHLMANKISKILMRPSMAPSQYAQVFGSLQVINLEDNEINDWVEVWKLSYIRSLQQLHLNKNILKHIEYLSDKLEGRSNDDVAHMPFENLQRLLLGNNKIDELASVDSLNLFPALIDIRLSENPVADPAKGGVPRFVLVARLANVKVLNGSEVSPRERKEAEIRYVRLVMSKLQLDAEDIKKLHPRYAELKTLHGIEDENPSTRALGPQKMASGLISVTLKCVGASMGEKPLLTKKLPSSTTVGKLKSLCETFFKLKDIKLRLYIEEEGCPLPQLLESDMDPLSDLGITSGTVVLVDEEDS